MPPIHNSPAPNTLCGHRLRFKRATRGRSVCATLPGAMNAWDRTAYISDVKYGKPSYEAQMNNVNNNFIIANYGASQGFDTDDGSSCESTTQATPSHLDEHWKMGMR